MALLIEIASFIRLRYTQPDRPRDYRVLVEGTPCIYREYTCIYRLASKEVCGEEAEAALTSHAAPTSACLSRRCLQRLLMPAHILLMAICLDALPPLRRSTLCLLCLDALPPLLPLDATPASS